MQTRIQQVPGVTRVTWSNWFGGIYKDRKNFFAQFAIEAQSALEVFDIRFDAGSKEAFLADRNSCIVGKGPRRQVRLEDRRHGAALQRNLPRRLGLQDRRHHRGRGRRQHHQHHVLPLGAPRTKGCPIASRTRSGVFTIKVQNANDSPRVIKDIDALFANSEAETHSETEKSFRLQFVHGVLRRSSPRSRPSPW